MSHFLTSFTWLLDIYIIYGILIIPKGKGEQLMEKEEMIENIKALIQYHEGLWNWYWNKNQRDKRMEHFHKMQVLEDLLQMIGENTDGKDN